MPKQKTNPVSVRSADLASAITQPKGASRVSDDTVDVIRYDFRGRNDSGSVKKMQERDACAQVSTNGRNSIYKIKSRRGGKLYNPLVNGRDDLGSTDKTSNNSKFQFREVNKQAFEAYVKFLQTGYDSHLLSAEREA